MKNILFLCTGNSCRSIMAECLLRVHGGNKFLSYSAGSNPTGKIHPMTLKTLENEGVGAQSLHSKAIDEFKGKEIDIVITVCNNAANEYCPTFLGNAVKKHWDISDPSLCDGSEEEMLIKFKQTYDILKGRIIKLCSSNILDLRGNYDK